MIESAGPMPEVATLALMVLVVAGLAGAAVYWAIPALMPFFRRYAMARPSVRSSHRIPTPQGGGAAIMAAVAGLAGIALLSGAVPAGADGVYQYYMLTLAASVALALMGANDDIRPMTAGFRFLVQTVLAGIVVFGAPEAWRLFPALLPLMIERLVMVVAFVWMSNLTNFMDGIDGIVVAEATPVAAVLAILALIGVLSPAAGVIAAALAGAMLGFEPHNRHPARLFLGDVGSLPIGLLTAALLFELAATQSLVAALVLPLYFLFDATATLLAGLVAGHDVTRPHRRHAYQRAVDSGWSAPEVTRMVWKLNLALSALAGLSVWVGNAMIEALLLASALVLTGMVIRRFRQTAP